MEGDFSSVLNNLESDHLDSIDTKLSDAINLYARKSQVEELFKGYLHAFDNNEHNVLWMPKTLKSFRSCCKALHFETVIRVWIILNDELKKATFKEIETVDRKVFPVLRLFTEFVNSICLSQVPEKALIQIVACIVDTQEMTVGFIELCLSSKNASHMTHFLHLLTIIGELIFKFPMLYQRFRPHSEPCQESNKLFSICSIIIGFSDKKAAKVHAFMISQPDRIAFLGWLNLLLFKVKCSSLNLWNNEALIALCDFVVLDLLESIDFNQNDEYTSVFWSTLCCSYHSIYEACMRTNNPSHQNYNSTFSKKLVQSLCHRVTYQDTTNRFFSNLPNSDVTSDLLNELCSQFLGKLCEIFHCKKKRTKKMKNGLATNTMVTILESLNQTLPQLLESSTQESITGGLQSLLDESITLLSNKSQESFSYSDDLSYILKALLNYLVPFMNRLQKMKCSIVSVMILCRGTQDLNVTTCCLLIIANSLHHIKCTNLLLKYISPATFCSWVLSLYDHFSSDEVDVLLCRKLCRRIFDSFVSAVLKNVVELKKTKVFFKKICKESHDYSNCNFEHILMTSNLIWRALNQQYVECSPVLKKIAKKLLLKTYSCFESFHEMNKEEWFLGEGKKCLPLIMETMVSLLKHSNISDSQSGKENDSTEMNVFKQVLSFKNYPLTIIKMTEDPDILLNCIDFIKEICIGQFDISQNEFLDEAFDVSCQKLRNQVEPNNLVPSNPLEIHLSELASLLLLCMNKKKLSIALQSIFSTMDSKAVSWCDVYCIMKVWQSLLDQKIGEEIEETMIYSCQHIVISIQKLFLRNPPAYATISMLNTLSILINKKPNFLLIQDLSILLHFTHSVNLESFPSKSLSSTYKMQLAEFVAVFQSYYKVLDAILSSHPESVKCLVPTLTAATKKLLQASMWGGQQMTGVTLSQGDLQDLEKCARSVERLAASMQEYKLDFTKVAHLLVAEFADCSQKVTLYSVIKMPLLQAVYLWLDMCDEHTTAQLQITLSAGAKEIYRDIYNEFSKYHKYRG